MARLGSKLPFREAVEELVCSYKTAISEPTCRRVTYRSGEAAEAIIRSTVEQLEEDAPDPEVRPEKMLLSADGSFILLTTGEWLEVKSVAIGEFETDEAQIAKKQSVKTKAISYFSRSYPIRDFERYALGELHRRGMEKASLVVAVNDGAQWIQSFLDYHCPKAVRIIDFAHALSYVSDAGKAIWGEGTAAFAHWFEHMAHQLKHLPPQRTLADLQLLKPKAKTDEQGLTLDRAILYLQTRLEMIDYPYFQSRGYPIGSGCVESGHKVVVQRRLKGAGMRWARHHVDPMLSLRDLTCNRRWQEGWSQIVAHLHCQQRLSKTPPVQVDSEPTSQPLTFANLQTLGLLPDENVPDDLPPVKSSGRPAHDHPWRNNIYPTREAYRWN